MADLTWEQLQRDIENSGDKDYSEMRVALKTIEDIEMETELSKEEKAEAVGNLIDEKIIS